MGSIEPRTTSKGTTYRARISLKGFPRLSETFTTERAAERWMQKTETAMREGRFTVATGVNGSTRTFGELIERFVKEDLDRRTNPESLKLLLYWWQDRIGARRPLAQVTPALLSEHRATLKSGAGISGQPLSPSTINGYLTILSSAFACAVRDWFWLEENPCLKLSRIRPPRGRVRFLSDGEREALLEACRGLRNKKLYPLALLAIATGARQGELINLRWKHVDLARGVITFDKTKNGDRRSVPVLGLALSELKRLSREKSGSNFVFIGRNGGVRFPQGQWEKARSLAGLVDFKWHDLRHTAAAYLAMSGASLLEIAEVLGHRTLDMVRRYAHLTEGHTRDVVRRMNAKYLPESQKPRQVLTFRKPRGKWFLANAEQKKAA